MKTINEKSAEIAIWMSRGWEFCKSNQFLDYLIHSYNVVVPRPPCFECFLIAETEEGDLVSGRLGGIVRNWWIVDNNGIKAIKRPEKFHLDNLGMFDKCPIIKFYFELDAVVFSERFGPKIISRKRGKIASSQGLVSITDICVLWTTKLAWDQGGQLL